MKIEDLYTAKGKEADYGLWTQDVRPYDEVWSRIIRRGGHWPSAGLEHRFL